MKIKKWEIALFIGFILAVFCSGLFQTKHTVTELQQHVVRMHILANSDNEADQSLKYAVRDALLAQSEHLFGTERQNKEQLAQTAKDNLSQMEQIAQQVVTEAGYPYSVKAEWITMPFTERTYEDLTMPAGMYETIRITIGEAKGKNWWCVMYPPLCIPVAEEVVVADEQTEAYFTEAEQDMLYHPERYRVKLKLVEWLQGWFTEIA